MPKKTSFKTIGLLALSAGCISMLAACEDDGAESTVRKAPPPSVSVAAAFSQDVRTSSEFVGKVEAIDEVDLQPRVAGYLAKKAVDDGAVVAKGDLLFQIEPGQYQAAVAATEATLAKAEANKNLADADLQRDEGLYKKGHISKAKFDAGVAARDSAAADVASAKAALIQARLQLDYTEISAPFAGRIGRTRYSVGDVVGPSAEPVARLIRMAPIYVQFSISEKDLVRAKEQMKGSLRAFLESDKAPKINIRLPTGEILDETGRIVFIDNRVDPATGTIAVRGRFENAADLLIPGQFVGVVLESAEAESKLLIPQSALQRDQKGTFVLAVGDDQMVEQRYVVTGEQVETAWVVEKGLKAGERVIVQGLQKVRPGVPVNPVLDGKPAQ